MILNGEADVLRDEGEAFARKLRDAGVPVTAMRFFKCIGLDKGMPCGDGCVCCLD